MNKIKTNKIFILNNWNFYILEALVCGITCLIFKDLYIINIQLFLFAIIKIIIEFISFQKVTIKTQILSSIIILITLATFYFHNPIFLKWKSSMIYFLVSLFILLSPKITKQSVTASLVRKILLVNREDIMVIDFYTGIFVSILFIFNVFVAKYYTDDQWIFFKSVICPLLIILFIGAILFIYREKAKILFNNQNKEGEKNE